MRVTNTSTVRLPCRLHVTLIRLKFLVDDCWSVKSGRDKTTGRIVPDTTKFPDGISGLADKLHGLGFKIGIYSDAGTKTCAGYPGSLYNEHIDAKTFAEWGVDCKLLPAGWFDRITDQKKTKT
jgi:hypothetical protein